LVAMMELGQGVR